MSGAAKVAAPLQTIIDLTFQVAVNGHLDTAAEVSREQIGEIYEAAGLAMAERAQLVEAVNVLASLIDDSGSLIRPSIEEVNQARALLRYLGEKV